MSERATPTVADLERAVAHAKAAVEDVKRIYLREPYGDVPEKLRWEVAPSIERAHTHLHGALARVREDTA